MAVEVFVATPREKELIRHMHAMLRGQITNPRSRPGMEQSWGDGEDHQAPEVYLAAPLDPAGIPALDNAAGTATGTGTVLDDVPGNGMVQVYNIAPNGGSWKMVPVTGLRLRVFNITTGAVGAGPSLIVVQRTKYGFWVPVTNDLCGLMTGVNGYSPSVQQFFGHNANEPCRMYDSVPCTTTGTA